MGEFTEEVIKIEVQLVTMDVKTIWGLYMPSEDKHTAKDIEDLSREYRRLSGSSPNDVPYFVLSRDYDKVTGRFNLFVGGLSRIQELDNCTLPQGIYAVITVKPLWGFFWGAAIGRAKRFFYEEWLPSQPYEALNLEYEFHTDKTIGRHPSLDIIFALKPQEASAGSAEKV